MDQSTESQTENKDKEIAETDEGNKKRRKEIIERLIEEQERNRIDYYYSVIGNLGALVWLFILSGCFCVIVGLVISYSSQEISVPSLYGYSSSRREVITLPNLVQGVIWIGAGLFQLLLAFMLIAWRIAKVLISLLFFEEFKEKNIEEVESTSLV